jgi:two-component system, NarL family, response regulator LiaR
MIVSERPNPIRVLIVDDHPLARSGLRTFLNAYSDLEMAGEADNGAEALSLTAEVRPDVVLMDLVMPEMDGVEATRRLKAAEPELTVIALTSVDDGGMVERALRAGASGYLLKTVGAVDLAQAIRAAHAGRRVLGPEAADALAQTVGEPRVGADLSEREREVLALVAAGLSNGQIAERLAITRATVKYHVGSILGKLGVATRPEAIALAYQRKLVT